MIVVKTKKFSLRLLKLSPVIKKVTLIDGSKHIDNDIQFACNELGVDYIHTYKSITY